jgi:hypothetical protein
MDTSGEDEYSRGLRTRSGTFIDWKVGEAEAPGIEPGPAIRRLCTCNKQGQATLTDSLAILAQARRAASGDWPLSGLEHLARCKDAPSPVAHS